MRLQRRQEGEERRLESEEGEVAEVEHRRNWIHRKGKKVKRCKKPAKRCATVDQAPTWVSEELLLLESAPNCSSGYPRRILLAAAAAAAAVGLETAEPRAAAVAELAYWRTAAGACTFAVEVRVANGHERDWTAIVGDEEEWPKREGCWWRMLVYQREVEKKEGTPPRAPREWKNDLMRRFEREQGRKEVDWSQAKE